MRLHTLGISHRCYTPPHLSIVRIEKDEFVDHGNEPLHQAGLQSQSQQGSGGFNRNLERKRQINANDQPQRLASIPSSNTSLALPRLW
jgi:hypothetical protein